MKTLIASVVLAASFSASAQMVNVYPRIYNFGNQAQVQVYNSSEFDVNCSGFIYLNTQRGRMESHYYSDYIYRGHSSMRFFYLRDFQDNITYSHHSIRCQKVR